MGVTPIYAFINCHMTNKSIMLKSYMIPSIYPSLHNQHNHFIYWDHTIAHTILTFSNKPVEIIVTVNVCVISDNIHLCRSGHHSAHATLFVQLPQITVSNPGWLSTVWTTGSPDQLYLHHPTWDQGVWEDLSNSESIRWCPQIPTCHKQTRPTQMAGGYLWTKLRECKNG